MTGDQDRALAAESAVSRRSEARRGSGRDGEHEDWIAQRSRDDAPFDADTFWGQDDFMDWHPEARLTTAAWLESEPSLSETYARPDTSWGFDYEPASLIDPSDRDVFERDAEALGYQIVHAAGLEQLHLAGPGPSPDVDANVRALQGGS